MTKQEENKMTHQLEAILTEIATDNLDINKDIHQIDEQHIQIKNQVYQLVVDYREGFKLEAFEQRYQEYFEKFDFIVGDWGYEQLRLRGFYQVNQRKVPRDQQINFLDDYLKEYCNFGCQYFVIAKDSALEKYQQYLERSQNMAVPVAEVVPANSQVSTKKAEFTSSSRRRKRNNRPGNSNDLNKRTSKEEFQIRNQANQQNNTKTEPKQVVKHINVGKSNDSKSQAQFNKGQSRSKKSFVIKKKMDGK